MSPALSPDNRLVAAESLPGARVWELGSGREVAFLEQSANSVASVTFSPDGKRLVTGLRTGGNLQPALRVWDYTVERAVLSLYSHGNWNGWTEFSPDGNTLVTVGWFGTVDLYHAPSWAIIETAENGAP
jgi:WD40 repeat protein